VLDRFSDGSRRVVSLAEAEARRFGHSYVGTEHLLLGILAGGESPAADALVAGGATLDAARDKVAEVAGGTGRAGGDPQLSDRARRALERASRLSLRARDPEVSSEHILLAVLDVEGRAGQVLRSLAVDLAGVRNAVDPTAQPAPPGDPERARAPGAGPVCPSCGAALDSNLAHRTLASPGDDGEIRDFVVAYCGACRTALGSMPA
jgi:ATP-dependent Clp protease ATP-binding subunit ClpC